jgi:hypothetical protein
VLEEADKRLVGAAGVHYVAAELLRRGYLALPTTRNTKGADIVVCNESKTVKVQVKTTHKGGARLGWILGDADEQCDPDVFYVLVNLRQSKPDYYVVPSTTLGPYLQRTHSKWMRTLGKRGQPHRHSGVRRFPNEYEEVDLKQFEEKWDIMF